MSNKKLKTTELNRISVEEFKTKDKHPIIVVLDNVRSMNNIGSIFRTADAFSIKGVYLCGYTATPPHKDIQKTALGAQDSVDWSYFDTTQQAIEQLKNQGYKVVSVEQTEETTSLLNFELKNNDKIALVMGNEVKGVQQEIVDASDVVLEVPQWGTKHSLNISVCTGVVLWDLVRKMTLN